MDLKKIKKLLSTISIISLVIIVGILISAIFGAKVFNGITLKIILTCALLTSVSTFSLSALTYIDKKKTLSIVNLLMLLALCVCGLIIIWFNLFGVFGQITMTLAIATVLIGIINSNVIKLGKRYFKFQILAILVIAVADVLLTLIVWNLLDWKQAGVIQWFVVAMIVAFAMTAILSILARKSAGEEIENLKAGAKQKLSDDEMVIKKSEYEAMQQKIAELESKLNALNNENIADNKTE